MKTYYITRRCTEAYTHEFKANSREEALEKAQSMEIVDWVKADVDYRDWEDIDPEVDVVWDEDGDEDAVHPS